MKNTTERGQNASNELDKLYKIWKSSDVEVGMAVMRY